MPELMQYQVASHGLQSQGFNSSLCILICLHKPQRSWCMESGGYCSPLAFLASTAKRVRWVLSSQQYGTNLLECSH